jgi:small-conductance mechanosensitive channel
VQLTLALICSLGATALLCVAIGYLQRASQLVRKLAFPLYVGALAAGLKIFTLLWSRTYAEAAQDFEKYLSWVLMFFTAVVVLRVIGLYLFEYHLPTRRQIRLPPLLPLVTMGVAYLLTALITVKIIFPEREMTGLLATSAVTSLVLGLALQPILGNFFAGLVISLEKPFRINDWIQVGQWEGRVVQITWRTTHLRTRDNDNVVIPNGKIADEQVLNFYYPQPLHLHRVYVGVHYRTPPHRVKRALLDAAAGVEGVLEKPTQEVYLRSFDDSSIQYELRVWIADTADAPRIDNEIKVRIWEEFRRSGITIPFPIRTLELAPRSRPRAAVAGAPRPARLFIADGLERGTTVQLDGRNITVGRSHSCTLSIADGQASKEHLRIEWTPDGYVLTDLQSSFGTRVNGVRVDRKLLADLDRIAIGETVLVFESDGT